LTRHRLRALVDDDDMALFEMLDQSMQILEVETATSVIAALWGTAIDRLATRKTKAWGKETHELILAFHGGERVHDRTSVRLHGGGYLSCIPEVGRTKEEVSKREG
jgi:hypothetical protein